MPFVRRCLRRIVANVLSIGLVVRMWHQFSAGKSQNVSSRSRSFRRHRTAASYLASKVFSNEIQPPDHVFDRLCLPQILRQHAGREHFTAIGRSLVTNPRLTDGDRAGPRRDLSFRKASVADDQPAAGVIETPFLASRQSATSLSMAALSICRAPARRTSLNASRAETAPKSAESSSNCAADAVSSWR